MQVVKKDLKDGSCNFCNRGIYHEDFPSLYYPYSTVYEISKDSGSGMSARLCGECVKEFKNIIKLL
jgi:hypothetical protein